MIVLYNLPTLVVAPMAIRICLLCETSRAMIISVRRTFSESEIERYGTSTLKGMYLSPGVVCQTQSIRPSAVPTMSVYNPMVGPKGSQRHTKRGKVHQAGEGNYPVVHSVENAATI